MAWGWLKKIFKEEKQEEKKVEAIGIEELQSRLDAETKKVLDAKENAKRLITEKVADFAKAIREQIKILGKIDIDRRKEQDKIKLIVKENLRLYADYLSRLSEDLENAASLGPEGYIKKASQILHNFQQNSRNSFEKATILIGKELGEARQIVNELYKNLEIIFNENKKFFEKTTGIKELRDSFSKLEGIKRSEQELEEKIANLSRRIKETKNEIKKAEEEILNVKKSEECLEDFEEKEKIKAELQELERKIQLIKEKADLRALAKHFHSDKKKSELIKRYAEDFKSAMQRDAGLEIISLAKEAKGIDVRCLHEIKKRILELSSIPASNIDKSLILLENEMKKLNSELSETEFQISGEKKKKERLREKKESIIQEIKKNAEYFGLEVK